MTLNTPLVSVIMPVYNGAVFLAEAIENLRQQQYEPLEIIIVDDGSTDNTGQIVAGLGSDIRYVCQTNQGPAAARNHGLQLATGEVIAFLDVDDLWTEHWLSTQVGFLAAHPAVDVVQGLIQELQLVTGSTFEPVADPYYSVNLGSAIYRRRVFDWVGLFDETLHYNEDTDWFIRAWDKNVSKTQLAEVALFYRKHEGNMTNGGNSKQSGFVWLLKKRLDQHRKNSTVLGHVASGQSVSLTEYIGWQK
ncbi:MAG: glycosyltransferase family 2 protein [Anaerolineae bacterium]|nr:glycosyltransferase family 2 protein [Anaerolineae bacterium]